MIEAAASWSSLAGGLAAGIADAEARGVVGTTLGTGLAGLGTAIFLTHDRAPSSGDVALANSGGIWGVAAGGLALLLVESPGEDAILGTLLAGAGVGLGAGALAGTKVEISRGRSLLVDAGGLVGGLVGLSIPLFARSEDSRAYGVSGLLGLGAGLAGGAWLTRGWDDDAEADRRAGMGSLFPTLAVAGGEVRLGLAGAF